MKAVDHLLDGVDWQTVGERPPDASGHHPRITHTGVLKIKGRTLNVFQLEDGSRIIANELTQIQGSGFTVTYESSLTRW